MIFVVSGVTPRGEPSRSISWWWSAPENPEDPLVEGLLDFVKKNTDIVTTVIARCGIYTCLRNESSHRPNATCLNNGGIGGKIGGNISRACAYAIPKISDMGVRVEIWLGEDDSYESARYLFDHAEETAADLLDVASHYPDIRGFNIDLEPGRGEASDTLRYAQFLGTVTNVLNQHGLRFSADVGCRSVEEGSPGMNSNCTVLARSGVNRLMNMRTYNALSYEEWVYTRFEPSIRDVDRHDVIGMGLGCWIDEEKNGTWSTTPESAELRICYLMNQSALFAPEIDMFTLRQTASSDLPPYGNFPETFWIAPLRKWMAGGGCENATTPKRTRCPNATVGPSGSWKLGGDEPHCCVSFAHRGNGETCNKTCALAECLSDPGMEWKPENYSTHPYTCCRAGYL
eukprot:g813.t1